MLGLNGCERLARAPAGTYHFTDNTPNIPPGGISVKHSTASIRQLPWDLPHYLLLSRATILEVARTEPARWGLAFAREVDL
ncbi:hypothetical protein J2X98_003532 [Pseudarthrobacter enclensis]|uniref:Uncharacterized protein n=1 Tax=Pseudarthrobacter enclensis TaxID=993070 RepID=A0ABT9RXE9_9MICC|nr:hypothetical protein [Pseudarthrobacter enclensis]